MSDMTRRTFLAGTAGMAATGLWATQLARATSPAPRFDLDRFIDDVKRARPEGQAAVEAVLARAVAEPRSVLQGLGEPEKAEIRTLYRDPDLSIFNIIWAPRMVLPAHNHLMWASIGIYTGREDNILWKPVGQTVEASTAASLSEQEVLSLPEDVIHSVVNPIDRLTGAIHIYGGDLSAAQRSQWDPLTLQAKPFDMEETRRMFQEANERYQRGG